MISSLTELGESLSAAYRSDITQWFAFGSSFTQDDLPASFNLADDITRMEGAWQLFAELVPTNSTNFLPQDLLGNVTPESPPTEVQTQASDIERKLAGYPFTSLPGSGWPGLSNETSRGDQDVHAGHYEPLIATGKSPSIFTQAANQRAGSARDGETLARDVDTNIPQERFQNLLNRQSPDESNLLQDQILPKRTVESNEDQQTSRAQNKNNALGSAAHPFRPISNDGYSATANLDVQGINPPASPDSPHQLKNVVKPTADGPNTYSDSIWTRPLQNLGGFASQLFNPGLEETANTKSTTPADADIFKATPLPKQIIWDQNESSNLVANDHPAVSNPGFETVTLPGSEYFQLPVYNPAAQPFEQEFDRHTPDTDDLLEALTERIVRDFRRYYP